LLFDLQRSNSTAKLSWSNTFMDGDHFDTHHSTFMKLPEVIACLRKHGVDASDLQTHSIRKTGATFGAASEFVSLMTICLRAAWAITAVTTSTKKRKMAAAKKAKKKQKT
jgi:hypothetical protein